MIKALAEIDEAMAELRPALASIFRCKRNQSVREDDWSRQNSCVRSVSRQSGLRKAKIC